jgi:hypothetical protein
LSDRYERKARLIPGLITAIVFLPGVAVLSSQAFGLVTSLSLVAGIGVVGGILLAYLASAFGRAYELKKWPRRPHDLPTNRWLRPNDETVSQQQKERWYATINDQVGLNIPAAAAVGEAEQERVINDAVRSLREKFRDSQSGRFLQVQNEDYGFVRNLTGLRVIWLPASVASSIVTWISYLAADAPIIWPIAATGILALAVLCHLILPSFVVDRSHRYAETFYGCLSSLQAPHQ